MIGVAGNVRSQGLEVEPGSEIYLPVRVAGYASDLLVRATGEPLSVAEGILHAVRFLDPEMAVTGPFRLDQARNDAIASPRLIAVLLSLFAVVALARLLLSQGLVPVLWGLGLGLVGALALMRPMAELLFEVGKDDPITYAAVPLVILVSAAVTCLGPARRALRISPLEALRAE